MALPKLFDPTRPGPGVSKNGPPKKRFFLFWELYFRKFFKLIGANVVFVLFSLPIVTVGLAEVGLTYITRNFAREKHAFIWGDFIATIKKNWKQALPIGFINFLFELFLIYDIYYYSHLQVESSLSRILVTAIAMLLFVVFTFMRYYIPLMLITFKLTVKQLYKNALIFAFVAVWQNLLISVGIGIYYFFVGSNLLGFLNALQQKPVDEQVMAAYFSIFLFLFIIYLLFFPAFRSFLIQFTIFPKVKKYMIDPYYKEHPGADKEQKRALNIRDEETKKEEEAEAVFEDRGRTADYSPKTKKQDLPPIPKQYSEREMRRFNAKRRKGQDGDDDGTI